MKCLRPTLSPETALGGDLTCANGQCQLLASATRTAAFDTAGHSLCLEILSAWLWHVPLHFLLPSLASPSQSPLLAPLCLPLNTEGPWVQALGPLLFLSALLGEFILPHALKYQLYIQ